MEGDPRVTIDYDQDLTVEVGSDGDIFYHNKFWPEGGPGHGSELKRESFFSKTMSRKVGNFQPDKYCPNIEKTESADLSKV